jgi:quercetin dioxygenase-like cupin family protein
VAAAAISLALAAVLTGCGGSSGDASSSSASGSASASGADGNRQVLLDNQRLTVLDQPIAYPKKKAQVTSTIVALEPGQETGWQKTNVPTYAYVLDGTITVEYDAGVTKEFPAGTALMQAQGVWHNATNKGDQPPTYWS